MIDGNISMEEDTELRDLVVQTLENNGVLAKVRAELRASVFLTLEEQVSVLNPEQFLNKPVKQHLASSEGKLLFSLVREFLEYFGLDFTISVYDTETYFGKEYNYVGRNKLCEELGINSKESLLGEILKNTINGALNNSQKNNTSNNKIDNTSETSTNLANATFDVSVPKVLQNDLSSNSINNVDKLDYVSNSNSQPPICVTITDKKRSENSDNNEIINSAISEVLTCLSNKTGITKNLQNRKDNNTSSESITEQSNRVTNETNLNINHNEVIVPQIELNKNTEINKSKKNIKEFQSTNNTRNKNQTEPLSSTGKTVFFDEIIVDGIKEKLTGTGDSQLLLGELPPLTTANNSVFGDLPPLNGKKANISDLKELMDIAQGVSQYDNNLPSSASGSIKEQNSSKSCAVLKNSSKIEIKEDSGQNLQSENESEEIDEEIPSSTSCLENISEKS